MTTIKKTTVTKKVKPTDEDKIFNNACEEVITKEVYDVFRTDIAYKVHNIQLGNNPTVMCGTMIKQFFGYDNKEAKAELESGAKEVILYEKNNKDEIIPLYKIEVLK